MRRPTWRATAGLIPLYVLLLLVTVAALGPALWIVVSSLKTSTQILSATGFFWPDPATLSGYVDAFTQVDLHVFIGNTVIYAAGGTVGALTAALLAAYPLTRFSFRGRNTIVAMFSVSLAIPVVGLATPEFFVMRQLGLFDSRIGMVVFYSGLLFPLAFVILRSFLVSLPRDIEEAAVIDGARYARLLFSIVLPLTRPAMATVAVVAFVTIWNEFFFANLLLVSAENQNVQTALASFKGQFGFNVSATLAGTTIVMLVPIFAFLVMQRHVIAGLTAGASK